MSGAIVAGSIAAGAGLAGAGISAHAAGSAADKQVSAANQAAQLQYQESQNALDFSKQQWNQTQQNALPWLQQGGAAENQLGYLLGLRGDTSLGGQTQVPNGVNPGQVTGNAARPVSGINGLNSGLTTGGVSPTGSPAMPTNPGSQLQLANGGLQSGAVGATPSASSLGSGMTSGLPAGVPGASPAVGGSAGTGGGFGSLMTPYSGHFEAPTDITEQNDPGYQARLKLGTDAIERSAAARGGVLTGGTGKALDSYGQDYASNEYGNVYNRALTGFQTNYNQYNNDQTTQFNKLAALAGGGQTAASNLASAGANVSNNVSSNLLNTGQQIGNAYQNAGAANASGIYNSGAAYSGALNGIGGNLQQLLLLKQLGLGGGSSGVPSASTGMFDSLFS